jgi:outer membrane protein assembly factor BamA
MGYGYEQTHVYDIASAYLGSTNPILRDSLLLDTGGYRTVGKVTPSVVYNTINVPIFPTRGVRYSASADLAGLGGSTDYTHVRGEGIWYIPLLGRSSHTDKVALGLRAEGQWIVPQGSTLFLPIFEKFFLGGEYSVRGFDMRSIGPRDPASGVVTGGNKSLLFNGELYFNVGGPVRVLAFYDAGQVRDVGDSLQWKQDIREPVPPPVPLLYDPFNTVILTPDPYVPQTRVIAQVPAFKVSTGLEVRFFMPVLNVPFRLIAAYNPARFGVLNNNLQATKAFTFRFAVGTTF